METTQDRDDFMLRNIILLKYGFFGWKDISRLIRKYKGYPCNSQNSMFGTLLFL